jgi:hypothetical protein
MERTFRKSPMEGLLLLWRPQLLLLLLGVALTGCGGSSSDGGGTTTPPPPPPPPGVPPLSTTVVNLDDGHQVGADRWSTGNTSTGGQGGTVAGLDCVVNLPQTFHIHSHLSILLNGEALAVPGQVGIVDTSPTTECWYPVHTHNRSGMIHVEGASSGTFTLGQLFQIWGQPLSSTDVAGLTGMPVVVYVTDNGTTTQNTGDWSAIELTSHRLITIQVGTAITEIPNFTWAGN